MTRAPRRAVAALLVPVVVLLLAGGATAQESPTPQADLALVGLTGVVGPGSRPVPEDGTEDDPSLDDVDVRVAITNDGVVPVEDLRITVDVHPAVGVRSRLHAALDDDEVDGRVLERQRVELDDPVAAGETLGVTVTLPGAAVPWPDVAGVLPLVVELETGTETLDTLTSAVVWLPTSVTPSLHAVVAVPLAGDTSVTTSGAIPADVLPAARPRSPLRTLLAVVAARVDTQLLTVPDVALVEELAARADGYTALDGTEVRAEDPAAATAAATLAELTEVLGALPADPVLGPYADADVAALASVQSDPAVRSLAGEAVTTARTRLQGLVGRAPDLGTYVASGRTTPAVVDVVRDQRILLPYQQTQGPPAANEPDLGPALGQVASDGGFLAPALVTDPHVDAILADTGLGDGLAARQQRLRAELAQLWLEAPNRDRLVLVMPEDDWAPGARLAGAWLDVLLGDPWLEVASARDAIDAVGPTGVVVPLAASTTRVPSALLAALDADLRLLAALEAASGDIDDREQPVSLPALRDALLRATSTLGTDAAATLADLDRIRDLVEAGFGRTTIADGAQITLASETGELPVTLQRVEGGAINVVVEVESPGRLVWEGEGQRQRLLLPPDSSRTVSFSARAVSRGTFPVTVTVLDPTETRVLSTATLSVRSTAISVPALWIIGGLVVGLLVVGRVRRRPRLELVRDDEA